MLYEVRMVVDTDSPCAEGLQQLLQEKAKVDVRAVVCKPLVSADTVLSWDSPNQALESVADPHVIDAWARANNSGAADGLESVPIVSGSQFEDRLLENTELVESARTFVMFLIRIAETALPRYSIFVTDQNGCCLDIRSDANTAQSGSYLTKGMVFSEAAIGNNGLGTALALQRPVAVRGKEHFNAGFHNLTTVGAPIMVGDDLAGGLGLVFPGTDVIGDFTALVGTVATSIGGELARKACQARLLEKHRALANAERQFHEVLDAQNTCAMVLDPEMKVVFWNKAAEALTGIPASQVLGRDLFEAFPGVPEGNAILQAVLDTSRSTRNQEIQATFGERKVSLLLNAFALHDAHGRRSGLVALFENLSAQKSLELEVMRSARQIKLIRTAFDGLTLGVVILNRMGRLLYLNRAASEAMGISEQEAVGCRLSELATRHFGLSDAEAEAFVEARLKVMSTGEALLGHLERFKREGREPIAFVSDVYPVPVANGKILGAIAIFERSTDNRRLRVVLPDSSDNQVPIAEAQKEGLRVSVHWQAVREAHGLRMNDFAEKILQINPNQYGKYERGLKLPSLPNILAMAERVKLPVEALYRLVD